MASVVAVALPEEVPRVVFVVESKAAANPDAADSTPAAPEEGSEKPAAPASYFFPVDQQARASEGDLKGERRERRERRKEL